MNSRDLESLGEEILKLIEQKGINCEMYSIGIRISREEYERLKSGLAGTRADIGNSYSLVTRKWAIQINYPFLEVKSRNDHS